MSNTTIAPNRIMMVDWFTVAHMVYVVHKAF